MGQTMTKTEPQGGQAPRHRRSLALDPVTVTRRSGQDGLCRVSTHGEEGLGSRAQAPGVWVLGLGTLKGACRGGREPVGKREAGRGTNRIGLTALTGESLSEPGPAASTDIWLEM